MPDIHEEMKDKIDETSNFLMKLPLKIVKMVRIEMDNKHKGAREGMTLSQVVNREKHIGILMQDQMSQNCLKRVRWLN